MKIKQFPVLTKDIGWHFTSNMLHSVFIFLNNGKNSEYEKPSCSCWLWICLAFLSFSQILDSSSVYFLIVNFRNGHNPTYVVQMCFSKFSKFIVFKMKVHKMQSFNWKWLWYERGSKVLSQTVWIWLLVS